MSACIFFAADFNLPKNGLTAAYWKSISSAAWFRTETRMTIMDCMLLQTSMVTLNFRMLFLWNGAASRRDVRSISSNISAPRWNIVTA